MTPGETVYATYHEGRIELDEPVAWPEGTRLAVAPLRPLIGDGRLEGPVIIAGFGLAGRCVADLLDQAHIPYTIVERNPVTVATQRALGKQVVEGDITDAQTLSAAGIEKASVLALTIPDDQAVLEATALARRLRPDLFIIARTNYASMGMRAAQLGADEVVKAEQAVALQFYERLSRRLAPPKDRRRDDPRAGHKPEEVCRPASEQGSP